MPPAEEQEIAGRKARNGRQARSALLWALAGFAVFQVGLAVAMARWLPELRDPFYGYKAKRLKQRLAAIDRSFSVVMLGSSRTVYGLKGSLLEDALQRELGSPAVVFSFGIFGAGPVMELLAARRLLADGVRPDVLLIEVLPALLGDQGATPMEANWLPASRLRLRELRLVRDYGFPYRESRRLWWEASTVPWYGHRFALLSRLLPAWLPFHLRQDWGRADDASGWSGPATAPVTPEQRQRGLERARLEYHDNLAHLRLGGPSCRALRELLALGREEGIATFLVLMPEGSEFRSWYPPVVWNQVQSFLGQLSRDYSAPLIDAREWVCDEHFADAHHLLLPGATKFTERLGKEVLMPFVRRAEDVSPVSFMGNQGASAPRLPARRSPAS